MPSYDTPVSVPQGPWISVPAAARQAGLTPQAIYAAIKRSELAATVDHLANGGKRYRIAEGDFAQYLARREWKPQVAHGRLYYPETSREPSVTESVKVVRDAHPAFDTAELLMRSRLLEHRAEVAEALASRLQGQLDSALDRAATLEAVLSLREQSTEDLLAAVQAQQSVQVSLARAIQAEREAAGQLLHPSPLGSHLEGGS